MSQTTAGCTCTNRLFDYSRLRGEVAALKKQVEELTAERDDARRYAVEARLRENQAEDRRVSESFARAKAEAEAAALRKVLTKQIGMQDVRLAVGEGKLSNLEVLAGVNAELKRRAALIERGADLPV